MASTESAMRTVETIDDLAALKGQSLGSSDWLLIDQERIDTFARVTGDESWIHVDVERAKAELPGGRTIAHGMLTLSLLIYLGGNILAVKQRSKGVNYGSNKVRFMYPVYCGDRIRLHRSLKDVVYQADSARVTYDNVVEIEGQEKPAMVAETVSVIYR